MSYVLSILESLKPYIVKGIVSAMPFVIDEVKKIIKKKEYNKMASFLITVKDKATSKAIEGATVNITIDGSGKIPYTTNADGQATISGLTVGTSYPVVASITGYDDFSESVVPVDEATALSVDIALTATVAAQAAAVVTPIADTAATVTASTTTDLATTLSTAKTLLASVKTAIAADSTENVTTAATLIKTDVLSQLETWRDEYIAKRKASTDPFYVLWLNIELFNINIVIADLNTVIEKAIVWIEGKITSSTK